MLVALSVTIIRHRKGNGLSISRLILISFSIIPAAGTPVSIFVTVFQSVFNIFLFLQYTFLKRLQNIDETENVKKTLKNIEKPENIERNIQKH